MRHALIGLGLLIPMAIATLLAMSLDRKIQERDQAIARLETELSSLRMHAFDSAIVADRQRLARQAIYDALVANPPTDNDLQGGGGNGEGIWIGDYASPAIAQPSIIPGEFDGLDPVLVDLDIPIEVKRELKALSDDCVQECNAYFDSDITTKQAFGLKRARRGQFRAEATRIVQRYIADWTYQ